MSTVQAETPVTRRDLRAALCTKAWVGLVAVIAGGWFTFQGPSASAGLAALMVGALCFFEAGMGWFQLKR